MSQNHDALMAELCRSVEPLRRFCRRLTRREEDAEELTQEALARALARPPRLDRPLVPWLVRVARNVHVDGLRKDRRLVEVDVDAVQTPAPAGSLGPWSGSAASLLRRHLGPRDLAVVLLREALDVSVADTAAALGMTAANVRVVHHRSLQRLQAPPPMSSEGSAKALERFDTWSARHAVQCVFSLVKAVGGTMDALFVPATESSRVWRWVAAG